MSTRVRHGSVDRSTLAWLGCLADPMAKAPYPQPDLVPGQIDGLIEAATHHSVLPAVVRRLRSDPRLARVGPIPKHVSETLAGLASRWLILSHQAERVIAGLAAVSIPAAIIKGPVFARRLYPDPVLRAFSDIDVLVPRNLRTETKEVMAGLGFRLVEEEKRAGFDYHEDQWVMPARGVLVEIQDDLVHAPSLAGMHFSYDDLADAGDGDPTAATGLLAVAAVHGAVGHQFEYLRFAVDVCQAARGFAGPIDVDRLKAVLVRTGTALALISALDLAGRLFSEPACIDLADRLGDPSGRRLCRLLLSPASVLRAQGPARSRDSWRRKILRELFKRHRAASGQLP